MSDLLKVWVDGKLIPPGKLQWKTTPSGGWVISINEPLPPHPNITYKLGNWTYGEVVEVVGRGTWMYIGPAPEDQHYLVGIHSTAILLVGGDRIRPLSSPVPSSPSVVDE